MNVLIADKFSQSGRARLEQAGFDVTADNDLKDESLNQAVAETQADVLVVRSTRVTPETLEAGQLRLVVRAGAGYNTIDVEAARKGGIYVSNCPGTNSVAVAELAFGLVLALDRRILDNVAALRKGLWNKQEFSKSRGLYGRTLGIVGVGSVGKEMIPRARAFGMPVVGWSRSLTPAIAGELGIEFKRSPVSVAATSDVVSVHLALNDGTRNMINEEFFDAMRPGAFFINTSRAEVVDEVALGEAVQEKGIRAGLDVFDGEPSGGVGEIDSGLFKLDGVIGTHHIGASTDQAQDAVADETCRIIVEFDKTGHPPNVVWE